MSPIVRRATPADMAAFYGPARASSVTTKAWAGILDGEVVGIGGFHFAEGLITAFLDIKPGPIRKYKVAIYKTALATMNDAKANGYRFVYADMDAHEANAARLLEKLGFERMAPDRTVYMWRSS